MSSFSIGQMNQSVDESKVVINRGRFNPAEFIGKGWSIITEETDTRSIALTKLDLTEVQHITMIKDGEACVNGEKKLRRLKKDGCIRLDADVFLTVLESQHLIPESWKRPINGNNRFIYFDGTVLRNGDDDRYVLYLYWFGGAWGWNVNCLADGWKDDDPSAVLPAS